MAGNNSSSMLLTLFIFSMVLSPMLPCKAARFTANGLSGVMRVLQQATPPIFCPACLCCAPAKPGECCPCFCPPPPPPES